MKSKIVKRVTMICLAVVYMLLACFAMSGCLVFTRHTEDFYYYTTTKDNYTYVSIGELTKKGKTKEVIVIPRKINGHPVLYLYHQDRKVGPTRTVFKSDALKKIYVPGAFSLENTFYPCPNLEKVICYEHWLINSSDRALRLGGAWTKRADSNCKVYIKSDKYDSEKHRDGRYLNDSYPDEADEESYIRMYFANVSYMYNYESEEHDGYYWIDDYDYGSKIEYIPKDPTIEGYTFGGWYREPECINKWNFDTDTLPEEKTEENEDGETIVLYQETKLYAKWTKKKLTGNLI